MRKIMKTLLIAGTMSLSMALLVLAGTWIQEGPCWTYTKDDGKMATSERITDDGKWYHFGSDSIMETGWIKDGGKYYYLGPQGDMYVNRWHFSGYYLGEDGSWIPDYKEPEKEHVYYEDDDDDASTETTRHESSSSETTSVPDNYSSGSSSSSSSTSSSGASSKPSDSISLTPGLTLGPGSK